ncbi:hypothetical protein NPIL_214231 [Nephila pilipes]|uniref:Secreted protein n=1 Tax=Nephila pilipes TaxID=299642 RepID=A0A8X6TEF6_NEPPI|nr:hypothetical protein NPIL_214231 [Nephila pilipes]
MPMSRKFFVSLFTSLAPLLQTVSSSRWILIDLRGATLDRAWTSCNETVETFSILRKTSSSAAYEETPDGTCGRAQSRKLITH